MQTWTHGTCHETPIYSVTHVVATINSGRIRRCAQVAAKLYVPFTGRYTRMNTVPRGTILRKRVARARAPRFTQTIRTLDSNTLETKFRKAFLSLIPQPHNAHEGLFFPVTGSPRKQTPLFYQRFFLFVFNDG